MNHAGSKAAGAWRYRQGFGASGDMESSFDLDAEGQILSAHFMDLRAIARGHDLPMIGFEACHSCSPSEIQL